MVSHYITLISNSIDFVYQDSNISWIQAVPFNINSTHFLLFKPEFVLFFYTVFLLLTSVYLRKFYAKKDIAILIYFGSLIVLSFILYLMHLMLKSGLKSSYIVFNFSLVVDQYTILIKSFILVFTIILFIATFKQLINSYVDTIEYSILLLFSIFFLLLLVSSYSMITLYMCLEGLSLLLYVLAAYPFNQSSIEAATKYFILGSFSSGLILFGIISIYGTTGSFDFLWLKLIIESQELDLNGFRLLGVFALLFGFFFKLGIFPCHMWTVDVYEGTWLPVTSFFMVIVKMGIFFFFIRLFFYVFYVYFIDWQKVIILSSIGSLFVGCIGSIGQNKLKRLFAYSSISQLGFSFLGLVVGSVEGIQISFFFFIFYLLTSLGILVILLNTESYLKGHNLLTVNDLSNFGHNNNFVALSMSIILLSMAGIPPLGGFFSKYFIFKLLIESSFYGLVIYAILISVINSFIYIRLIKSLLFDKYIIKSKDQDFFFFGEIQTQSFTLYNLLIYSILSLIVLIISLVFFYLDEILLNTRYLAESSFMITSIH